MADPLPPFWALVRFGDMYDSWEQRESPSEARRLSVLDWFASRMDNPYQGVRPESDIPYLWFGQIPGTRAADGLVVCCSYFIYEETRTVRCDQLASLSPPFGR